LGIEFKRENMGKISFWATKKVSKRTKVSFRNKYGERVSFTATKKVPRRVKVRFWAGR